MITNFTDVIIGSVITIITFMVILIAIKIIKKAKASEESIFNTISEYKVELIEIVQLCINLLSEDRDSMSDEEYNQLILDMTADYFRIFLSRETEIPSFIIDNITGEHIMEILDYINLVNYDTKLVDYNDIVEYYDHGDENKEYGDEDYINDFHKHIPPDMNNKDNDLGTEPITLEDEGKVDITNEIFNIMDDDSE